MRIACFGALLIPSLTAVLSHSPRAEACSPPPPGFQGSKPVDGATVPLNAVLYTRAFGITEMQASISDPATVTNLEVDNYGGLYRIPLRGDLVGPGLRQVVASSTDDFLEPLILDVNLSPEIDDEPPTLTGEMQISTQFNPTDMPGACVGAGWVLTFNFPAGVDNDAVAAQAIYQVFPNDAIQMVNANLFFGTGASVTMSTHKSLNQEGEHCFFAVAVDQAGNESFGARGGAMACVSLQLPGGMDGGVGDLGALDGGAGDAASEDARADARVDGGVDGGTSVDAGESTRPDAGGGLELQEDNAGCGCSAGERAEGRGWPGAVLVMMMALVLIRRRR